MVNSVSMVCPSCKQPSLAIRLQIELPADADWDEVSLQILGCPSCNFEALGVYQESRRGSLNGESWRHNGYRAAPEDWALVSSAIERCPDRANRQCQCVSHQQLRTLMAKDNERLMMRNNSFPIILAGL